MEPNQKIQRLLSRALRGKLSAKEWQELNHWYLDQEEDDVVINDYKKRSKSQVKREMLQNIEAALSRKKKSYSFYYFASAASVLLLITVWIFFSVEKTAKNPIPLHTVTNGVGMKKKIKLPDGSTITLFHNSAIQFDPQFRNNRDVYLTGKAFFEVAPDTVHPFTVTTPGFRTEVLGTSFMVDEGKKEVAVKTGKVKVANHLNNEMVLLPDQLLTYKVDKAIVSPISDHAPYFGWTNDQLYFKNTSIPELIPILEDWYGVKILSNWNKNITCHITGTYTDLTLENLLEAIQYSIPLTYKIHEDNVTITFSPCH